MIYVKEFLLFIYCFVLLYQHQYLLSSSLVGFYLFLTSRFDKLKFDAKNKTLEVDDEDEK